MALFSLSRYLQNANKLLLPAKESPDFSVQICMLGYFEKVPLFVQM